MNKKEIAKIIQKYYRFKDAPSEEEVGGILEKVRRNIISNHPVTQSKLDAIVEETVENTTRYVTDAFDMSSIQSILQQIIDAANRP